MDDEAGSPEEKPGIHGKNLLVNCQDTVKEWEWISNIIQMAVLPLKLETRLVILAILPQRSKIEYCD